MHRNFWFTLILAGVAFLPCQVVAQNEHTPRELVGKANADKDTIRLFKEMQPKRFPGPHDADHSDPVGSDRSTFIIKFASPKSQNPILRIRAICPKTGGACNCKHACQCKNCIDKIHLTIRYTAPVVGNLSASSHR